MSSLAHFTGVLYTPAWVLTLSVFQHGCGRPRRRTDGSKAPTFFFYVVEKKVIIQVGCLPVRNLSADVPGST